MKLMTLCSGIGAPEVAASLLGWTHALTCEIDPFCRRALEYWYPEAYHHGDLKTLNKEIINEELSRRFGADWRDEGTVLVAGFPCQPFSVAGKRKGTEDDRHLWPEVFRIVDEIRPDWFIGENVAGIATMVFPGEKSDVEGEFSWEGESDADCEVVRQRFVIDKICQDLEDIGYSVVPVLLPACALGAPHRRDRVWFVASRTDSDTDGAGLPAKGSEQSSAGAAGVGACGTAADTERGGRNEMDGHVQSGQSDGERVDSDGGERIVADTDGEGWNRGRNCRQGRPVHSEQPGDVAQGEPEWSGGFGGHRADGDDGFAADTDGDRCWDGTCEQDTVSERGGAADAGADGEDWNAGRDGYAFGELVFPGWENFPTQSPVCRGDDGISGRLSGLTFPKWRANAIKALGNSMVPPILVELFSCMEIIDNQERKTK